MNPATYRMDNKTEIATSASYIAASGGVAMGAWLQDHWLQILSAALIVVTYFTQLYFQVRHDRREERRLRDVKKTRISEAAKSKTAL